jgi:hypothetical protein
MKNKPTAKVEKTPEGLAQFLFTAMAVQHKAQNLSRRFNKTEWINAMSKALVAQTA